VKFRTFKINLFSDFLEKVEDINAVASFDQRALLNAQQLCSKFIALLFLRLFFLPSKIFLPAPAL
jgi:hypothetical protein